MSTYIITTFFADLEYQNGGTDPPKRSILMSMESIGEGKHHPTTAPRAVSKLEKIHKINKKHAMIVYFSGLFYKDSMGFTEFTAI